MPSHQWHSMLEPKSFLYEVREGVATITLNRPERLNALTFEVYRELTDTFAALRHEDDVRSVVITGAGRAFCSGGDVHDIIGELFSKDMEGLLEFTRMTCELIRNIRALPKPVIASLNGTTAGAGACIALASDIRHSKSFGEDRFSFCACWVVRRGHGRGTSSSPSCWTRQGYRNALHG